MPERKDLAQPGNVIYLYDGSFQGFLCCVHESVYSRSLPFDILRIDEPPITMLDCVEIVTDDGKAERVRRSVSQKISPEALGAVQSCFFTCLEQKELVMLRFLLLGYKQGGRLLSMLGDPVVDTLTRANRHMFGEVHLLKGFTRFSDYGGVLAGTISPKNFVLPFLLKHFCLRYDKEDFLIFDKTHRAALIYQGGKAEIIRLDSIEFPEVSETENNYRELWKNFYNTVAIEARENPRCRMTHMPKRYWENMLEVQELL